MFSKTWWAGGIFNGQDTVPVMSDGSGQSSAPVGGFGIEPWLDQPIKILCVDITFFQGGQYVNYSFAGNSYSPDIMRWWGQPNPIPSGENFYFPGRSSSPPHIDCHVSGLPGQPFQLFYTVYYSIVSQAQFQSMPSGRTHAVLPGNGQIVVDAPDTVTQGA